VVTAVGSRREISPARALLVIWGTEAIAVVVLASRLVSPLGMLTGFTHADDVPPGAWFLVHPPLRRLGADVAVQSAAPLSRWLQHSTDPAYCCWRRAAGRPAYPGYDTAESCAEALAALRARSHAPLALRRVSEETDVALAAARCIHKTELWKPLPSGDARAVATR
jgi:hypothetical protein